MKRFSWHRFFTRTIQRKFMLVMLVVSLAPLLVFGLLSYHQARDLLINQVGERLHAASHFAMSHIDRTFAYSKENVHSWAELAVMQAVANGDPAGAISAMLTDYQRTYGIYSSLVVTNASGHITAAGDRALLGIDVSQSPWFIETVKQAAPRMGKLRLDPYVGGYGVAISTPIFRENSDNEIIGILNASFSWAELQSTVNSIEVVSEGQTAQGYATLIDRDGFILAAPRFVLLGDEGNVAASVVERAAEVSADKSADKSADESNISRAFETRWWQAENPEVLQQLLEVPAQRYLQRDGRQLLVVNTPATSFDHLSATGWSLLLVRDAEDVLAGVASIRERTLLIALITAISIVVLAYFLAWQITRPIKKLSLWSKDFAKGNLNRELKIQTSDEIGLLAESLDGMRENIKGYIDELSEAREQVQTLIDSLNCVVWEASVEPFRIINVSGQVGQVLGYDAKTMRNRMSNWNSWIHENHWVRVESTFLNAIKHAQDAYCEVKAKHAEGHWVWLKVFISVVIEDDNVIGLRGVAVDISDIVSASEEMKEARDLAVSTVESKTRFLAIVSHEIRTPMNGMLGMLSMLKEAKLGADEQAKVDMACQSGKHLLELVNDVMDYAKLEAGEVEFHYARVDIQQLFHDVIAFVVTEAYDKGLDVGVVQESALPQFILADAVKLRQVLLILLANAVKFTGHGSILLWAEMLSQGRLYIEIRDTGVGISKEKQDEIFQPFTQEDASTTRHFEGSGLGLALCQRLVEAMGGSVGVRSIQGVGSSFFIELSVGVIDESKNAVGLRRHDFSTRCPASSALLIGDLPGTKTVMKITCQQWGVGFHWEPKESRVLRHLDEILHADNYRWIFIAQEMSERFWEQMNPYLNANDGVRVIQLRLPNETYGQRPLPHLYVPFTQEALANLMLDIRVEERLMSGGLKNATVSRTHLEATLRKNFPRMLVVDDNLVNRKIVCGFLKKMGFKTDVVGDGAQAVEAVKSNTYGMVFMDCQMPVMDGYEATRQIRKHFSSEVLPILAVTANALKGDREKCLAAGMDDYIAKPLQMDEMASKINFWVDKFHSKAQSKA